MTLNRAFLDQYLDGELSASQLAQVDQELRGNATAANLLKRLRRERALRAAALSTYQPLAQEITAISQSLHAAFDEAEAQANAPIAKIGPARWWITRFASVAAMLLIAAGSFWVGRSTSTPPAPAAVASNYVVHVVNSDGAITSHEFGNLADAKKFAQAVADKAMSESQVASADLGPGMF